MAGGKGAKLSPSLKVGAKRSVPSDAASSASKRHHKGGAAGPSPKGGGKASPKGKDKGSHDATGGGKKGGKGKGKKGEQVLDSMPSPARRKPTADELEEESDIEHPPGSPRRSHPSPAPSHARCNLA